MTAAWWWQGGTIYHVYVRSFQDSDGDGHGDLAGVRRRLDHLAWLGVDAVWLSPTMPSPNDDWGYDVADYLGVAADLGGMAQLDGLLADAGALGLRVLLDLVPNHTSAAHPWFVAARGGRDAPGRHRYVWADPAPGGGPPNNWRDATGESAWTYDPASGQHYLHNFLPGQPDLDWWSPSVHDEFDRILRFWWDRGVAGFRIDVAHALYKDAELRDDPPAPPGPDTRHGLEHRYSMNRPEVHGVYRRWRALADAYDPPRLLLGETWVLDLDRLAGFYGDDDELHLGFNFRWVFAPFTATDLSSAVEATLAALPAGACPVWVGSNHDVSRLATRWAEGDPAATRAALTILCTLPGTTVLYYGDELGLPDVDVPPDRQRDPMTRRAADGRFNRDRSRTPMPWEPGPGAGFTAAGVEPWLPVGDRDGRSVAEQLADPASTLHLVRDLLALRRRHLAGGVGGYETLAGGARGGAAGAGGAVGGGAGGAVGAGGADRAAGAADDVWAYRSAGAAADVWAYRSGPLVVAVNLSPAPAEVVLPDGPVLRRSGAGSGLGPGSGSGRGRADAGVIADGRQTLGLAPWEAVVLGPAAEARPA